MKILGRRIDRNGEGYVALIAEESEDMWHAYNLISKGDTVMSTTIRKVQTQSATGSVATSKVRITLEVTVEAIEFDTQAGVLRVRGRNVKENEYVKLGAYHTLDLELNRKFTLQKHEWDSVALDRLDLACDPALHVDLAAVVMQEGLAHVCLITNSMTQTCAKVESVIPRKRRGDCSNHDKAMMRFYDQVIQAILRHINFSVVKCILVASPGFIKDQFLEYMFAEAFKTDNRMILENRAKFVGVHVSSGHKQALKEALTDPAISSRIADTKAAGEVRALESFYQMLQQDPDRAFYGIQDVEKANAAQAVETLLISDELFRSNDMATRKRYVALVDGVKENCGTVRIFSSLHVSGEQLGQLTGVAAILRYPIPDIDDADADGAAAAAAP